ncbi:MAG: hypothetical protein ACLTTH_07975 [Holdemanella porci]
MIKTRLKKINKKIKKNEKQLKKALKEKEKLINRSKKRNIQKKIICMRCRYWIQISKD